MVVAKAKSARSKSPSKEKKDLKPKEAKRHKPESRVDRGLITKAVAALIKHNNDQSSKKEQDGSKLSLLGNDRPIQVQFGLEIPPQNASLKPIRILIPNPIVQVHHEEDKAGDDEGLEEPSVCLIVKDSAKASVKEFIEKFSEHMGCVKKVLTLDSLRKKHSRFQQRRELLQKYDIFMADDRILPMLTAALGKDFVKAKKLPLPICITRKEALPFAIQKNLSATYMTVSRGTSITVKWVFKCWCWFETSCVHLVVHGLVKTDLFCVNSPLINYGIIIPTTIRAGNTGMPEDKLVENILAIAEHAVDKIPRKWANIRNIAVKTPESTSLPFYNKLPEELLEIAKSAGLAPTFKDTKKEDDTGEKNDNDDSKKDESKKKRELVGKSPLIRALKKQKKESWKQSRLINQKHEQNEVLQPVQVTNEGK